MESTSKDNMQAYQKAENKHSKMQETGYEGHLSALYVIIELHPPLFGRFLSNIPPPDLQPLCPPHNLQSYIECYFTETATADSWNSACMAIKMLIVFIVECV